MKIKTIYLTLALLPAFTLASENIHLRYSDPAGVLSMEVKHDIRAGKNGNTAAGRTFSLGFELESASETVLVTLNQASGTYTAHDMTQRLPTSHHKGKSFKLEVTDDGLALRQSDVDRGPVVDLGWIVQGGYPISLALTDLVPVLPEPAVDTGFTWTPNTFCRSASSQKSPLKVRRWKP
jgi:hypothetical protein